MRRALILGTIFFGCVWLAYRAAIEISYSVDIGSLLFGLAIAALTGVIWATLDGWWSTVTKPYKPMTIVLETKQTPSQVSLGSLKAIAQAIIVIAIVIIAIVLMNS